MVLIDNMENNTTTLLRFSFRPLAGIMVLIIIVMVMVCRLSCFRPLAGIMVLILIGLCCLANYIEQFPSPCGDYGSYLLSHPFGCVKR